VVAQTGEGFCALGAQAQAAAALVLRMGHPLQPAMGFHLLQQACHLGLVGAGVRHQVLVGAQGMVAHVQQHFQLIGRQRQRLGVQGRAHLAAVGQRQVVHGIQHGRAGQRCSSRDLVSRSKWRALVDKVN
jgi:hypothetical protein